MNFTSFWSHRVRRDKEGTTYADGELGGLISKRDGQLMTFSKSVTQWLEFLGVEQDAIMANLSDKVVEMFTEWRRRRRLMSALEIPR